MGSRDELSDPEPGSHSEPSFDPLLCALAYAPDEAPPARPLPGPGERLGRWTIESRLGRGAAGVVYAAHDAVLRRPVAIKVLLGRSPERLLAEARAAARIDHQGVAAIFDALEIDGWPVMVMERIEGRTLREMATLDGRPAALPVDVVVGTLANVARAVHAAHRAGVIHMDLKPDNVMVTSAGAVKVLDFGLARAMDAREARLRGTKGYRAPEVGRPSVGPGADQYALGVMMVELLCGIEAVRAGTHFDRMPRRMARVARRAMAREPRDRFPDAAAFADALERSARGVSPWLGYVSFAGGVAVVAALVTSGRSELPSPGPGAPARVAEPPGAIACPPLAVEDPRDGWLGAAAASLSCRRAVVAMGGDTERAIPPAALLALPALPAESFPKDPYGDADARARALSAARASSALVLDGAVRGGGSAYRVELSVLIPSGEVVGASGEGPLVVAVATAIDGLVARGVFPLADELDPDVERRYGVSDATSLAAVTDATGAMLTGGGFVTAFGALTREADGTGPYGQMLTARVGAAQGDGLFLNPPDVDPGDIDDVMRAGPAHVALGGPLPALELAEVVAAAREADEAGTDAASMEGVEAFFRASAGQGDTARTLALSSIERAPWDTTWSTLARASYGTPSMGLVARAYTAWLPESADAWNIAAHLDADEAGLDRLELAKRSHRLGEGFPLFTGNLGVAYLLVGEPEEARSIAVRLGTGNAAQRVAAARLMTEIDLHEADVEGAFERSWRSLAELPVVGSIEKGDVALLGLHIELAVMLGREREAAANVYRTFLAVEPARVDRGIFAAAAFGHVCAYAEGSVASRCFDRLDELLAGGTFRIGTTSDTPSYLVGARAFALGDVESAVVAFRKVRGDMGLARSVMALALERAGELEAADAIDPPKPGLLGGVSQSYVRAARRAALRRDCPAARALQRQIDVAWARADAALPPRDALRRVLHRRCPE